MGISVTGVERSIAGIKAMGKRDALAYSRAVVQCAQVLGQQSDIFVPVDKGDLKASKKITSKGTGFATVAFVSYDTAYAVFVHENLQIPHRPPTRSRYLAGAVPFVIGKITKIMQGTVKIK